MILRSTVVLLSLGAAASVQQMSSHGFKLQQMRFDRVRAAAQKKEESLKLLLSRHGLSYPPRRLYIRAFKRERNVEVWAADEATKPLTLIKEYKACEVSGDLGPKRRQGDGQVPEGFYFIDRFNPLSNFHLSLGINYPNPSDRILGDKGNLGGDIFIHGGCATIGCIPITDAGIQELYLLAVEAKSSGQQSIPVHIFPTRLDDAAIRQLTSGYSHNQDLVRFWLNLKQGYDAFERTRRVPGVSVDRKGHYQFSR
jgi:murein L,D-transpeptidase YafK